MNYKTALFIPVFLLLLSCSKPANERYSGLSVITDSTGKLGFINETGTVVIPCKFAAVREFREGLAGVSMNDSLWGFIDTAGIFRITPQFRAVGDFSEGLCFAIVASNSGDKEVFVDRKGKVAISNILEIYSDFKYGRAICMNKDYQRVVIDRNGMEDKVWAKLNPTEDGIQDGAIRAWQQQLQGKPGTIRVDYFDTLGNNILYVSNVAPAILDEMAGKFSEGLVRIVSDNKSTSYYNLKGKKEIADLNAKNHYYAFSNSMARFKTQTAPSLYGFIGRSGKEVIPNQFDNAMDFSEGLAVVKKYGKWSFIDKTGNETIPEKFDEITKGFKNGLCYGRKGDQWGYINHQGVMVWKGLQQVENTNTTLSLGISDLSFFVPYKSLLRIDSLNIMLESERKPIFRYINVEDTTQYIQIIKEQYHFDPAKTTFISLTAAFKEMNNVSCDTCKVASMYLNGRRIGMISYRDKSGSLTKSAFLLINDQLVTISLIDNKPGIQSDLLHYSDKVFKSLQISQKF